MLFSHSADLWNDFPELAAGAIHVEGIKATADVAASVADFSEQAKTRLASGQESEFAEIQAWRRAYSKMGLKPTQYRCASEALLRRFRQEGALPQLHPLVDLCNAVSLAFAIPIAVFDLSKITGDLEVRRARGNETYLTFRGETEHPEPGEVIFADEQERAHARRWTNRQSGLSAVRAETVSALIVAEALHVDAVGDIGRLIATLCELLAAHWSSTPTTALLSALKPHFKI